MSRESDKETPSAKEALLGGPAQGSFLGFAGEIVFEKERVQCLQHPNQMSKSFNLKYGSYVAGYTT